MTTVWLRPDEVAVLLHTTVGNVHVLAHRKRWRRQGRGRTLRYSLDDINATTEPRRVT